ncbi:HNH endonuclease [Burkholderia sp. PR2]|uniref:HNH endonuclease n=1 Tax=Burkholderia sp. PR2 TaxID=3448078 RepID=UPI00402ABDD0
MTIDKRFSLIDRDGDYRYPYKKTQRATGRHGFVLGRDRHGQGEYADNLERVIQAVVFEGSGVRVKTDDDNPGKRGNTLSLHARDEIVGYWISPELLPLVDGAEFRPVDDGIDIGIPIAHAVNDPQVRVDRLTASDYVAAWDAVASNMTANQLEMLRGHASAPGRSLSMMSIARLGGYDDYSTANVQYGKLGRLFSSQFGIEGLENQTQALAIQGGRDDEGHWLWVLRPTLHEALVQLGMVEGTVESFGLADATREIDCDPKACGLSETTRQALINARIGQGGYRKRMLRLWGGKCAVTRCAIEEVLVASHAKPWAESSNEERLDEHNGLLLCASVDRLFDSGLISFCDEGKLLVNNRLDVEELGHLGLRKDSKLMFVTDRHAPYLKAHRERHGFPA